MVYARAARGAVLNPGKTYAVRHLKLRVDEHEGFTYLRMRLPSGRYLCYLSPEVDADGGCSYMGVDQYTRQWKRIRTHGGKLAENCTQAVARDVLFASMPSIEAEGYEIVLSVHDELLSETPDTEAYTHERLAALMSAVPDWAPGLPLAAAGFETTRYRKD